MSLTVDKCLQAWTNSLRQMNAKADIVFFGDSLVYYGDFASVFSDIIVCNLGLRGDTLQGMKNRVDQVSILEPRRVFLMAGINDVASKSTDEFREQYESLITALKEKNPKTALIILNMLPVNDTDFAISCNNEQIARCNKVIASLCVKHDLCYVDVFAAYEQKGKLPKELTLDGIHITQEAYRNWYKVISRVQ